jgi:hypothetical protein
MTRMNAAGHIFNPFSSRHIRPGALHPLTAAAATWDIPELTGTIRATGGSAAIEGPHGTGKSTLLLAVARELAATDQLAGLLQLRSRADCLLAVRLVWEADRGSTVCLDGWERLGLIGGLAVRLLARVRCCHLVVTSHRPTGLPLTVTTAGSVAILRAIVAALPDHGGLIKANDLATAFALHGGNLRESLSELYDRFETRARQPVRS